MIKASNTQKKLDTSEFRPALTPEARENQLITLAIDRAEQQLRDGTASSQVIVHYLKLASTKDRLEKELLEKQTVLLNAKTEMLQSAKRMEELYQKAIKAFTMYNGEDDGDY